MQKQINDINNSLHKRIFEISYKYKLSHIGSCITAVDIIDEIFKIKKPDEKFVLSSGHAGVALYVVIEKYEGIDAEKIWKHHGTHPDRCRDCKIDCSSGSLGNGLSIAVGMALADRKKNVYCLISDGECSEGSIWEAVRIIRQNKIQNIRIYTNFNGYGAYMFIDPEPLVNLLRYQLPQIQLRGDLGISEDYPFLDAQDAHYHILTKEEYEAAIR